MKHPVEILSGGTRVYTSKAHPVTSDSLLLLDFCEIKPVFSACDLGSGCGILLLGLVDKGLSGAVAGIEQAPGGVALLKRAIADNGLPNAQALQADLRDYRSSVPYDVVVCNPPYYAAGPRPPDPIRAAARHAKSCTVADVAQAARRLLKDGGRLYVCWPANRLAALFAALNANRLAPKRLQLVRQTPRQAPWLALVDARKARGEGLRILPDVLGKSSTKLE